MKFSSGVGGGSPRGRPPRRPSRPAWPEVLAQGDSGTRRRPAPPRRCTSWTGSVGAWERGSGLRSLRGPRGCARCTCIQHEACQVHVHNILYATCTQRARDQCRHVIAMSVQRHLARQPGPLYSSLWASCLADGLTLSSLPMRS